MLSYKNSPEKLWGVLNQTLRINKTERVIPNKLIVNNDETNDSQTIAQMFDNYFANIGKKSLQVIKQIILNVANHYCKIAAICSILMTAVQAK